jgi:2-polyprenyl-6-methoxyphenol hydroxylase-like FAD-dependent oxidoreductase
MTGNGAQVLVVGAGPAGLLLAGELERRDVPCLLIDALDAPLTWDRATVVHARSLEIFEALGLEDAVLADGVRTRGARFHSDGAVLGVLDFAAGGGTYPFDIGVSEEVTERVLTAFLESQGGSVTRGTRLVALTPGDDAVTATVEHDGEQRDVVVSWVVGCDGLHSAVREAAGIDYPGTAIDRQWAVFDTTIDGWQGDYDFVSVHLDVPPVILTPLPGQRWRAYVRPTSETSDLVAEAAAVIARYEPDAAFVDVENPVRFWCHSRIAASYRSGPILLAGDAAHACTPAEGHGMNTGLQDVFNLGWKLALVCRGEAGAALLDTYDLERRPVARTVVASGAATEAAHALTDPAQRAARDAELRRAIADPFAAHHDAAAHAEIDRCYPRSRAVAGDESAGASPGRRVPDTARVEPVGSAAQPLHRFAHRPGPTVLALGGPGAEPERMQRLLADLGPLVGGPVDAVVAFSTHPSGPNVGRMEEYVATQLGVTGLTVLVVRPDRYVGFRDDHGDAGAVVAYLDALVAP